MTPEKECTFEPPFKACAILKPFQGVPFFEPPDSHIPALRPTCLIKNVFSKDAIFTSEPPFPVFFGRASDSHLAEAFLLCFTHLLLLLLPTHTSYQYPSPVACLSSCGECSYGGFISIQIALAEPTSWFCPSASFNLPATPAAYSSS